MNGSLAEWLGTGLQNRLRRFESARNLKETSETAYNKAFWRFFFFGGAEIGAEKLISQVEIGRSFSHYLKMKDMKSFPLEVSLSSNT
jgi:hypothetical protein